VPRAEVRLRPPEARREEAGAPAVESLLPRERARPPRTRPEAGRPRSQAEVPRRRTRREQAK
jgi:hypothetical protein